MTHVAKLIFMVSLIASSFYVESRPVLGPPSIQLKTEISNIARVKLEFRSQDELVFVLQENIHNKATEQIVIRTTKQISKSV